MADLTQEELRNILEPHKKWCNREPGGERADLEGANLEGADLRGAYLEEAYLRGANLFGANLENATYGEGVAISAAPLQISGLEWEIIIFDNHIKIGCELHPIAEWATFKDTRIKLMNFHAIAFWHEHKSMIMTCAELHSKSALAQRTNRKQKGGWHERENDGSRSRPQGRANHEGALRQRPLL